MDFRCDNQANESTIQWWLQRHRLSHTHSRASDSRVSEFMYSGVYLNIVIFQAVYIIQSSSETDLSGMLIWKKTEILYYKYLVDLLHNGAHYITNIWWICFILVLIMSQIFGGFAPWQWIHGNLKQRYWRQTPTSLPKYKCEETCDPVNLWPC